MAKMILFFDTETTGLPKNYQAPVTDLRNWPRLVQLAWLLTDEKGCEVKSTEHLIKPQGFRIPADALRIHGITEEKALLEGVALESALDSIATDIAGSSTLVAHNMAFDEKILGAEFLRMARPNCLEKKTRKCTMALSTEFCKIPGPRGFKWPRLEELHAKLFGEGVVGAHSALVDVRACARCYFELRRRGIAT